MEWLNDQWNKPERLEYYLMQIAAEVRRVLAKNPNNIKVDDFVLTWKTGDEKPSKEQAEQKASWSKSIWMGLLGFRRKDGQWQHKKQK